MCYLLFHIVCAEFFSSAIGTSFAFLLSVCRCQTARCFNKSNGVLITGTKLKTLLNPSLVEGFLHTKKGRNAPFLVNPMDYFW